MTIDGVSVTVATAPQPGAVALLQLHGPGALGLLRELTGEADWPAGRLRLRRFVGIDEGLAVALGEEWVQLMPHGGPLVVRAIAEFCTARGAVYDATPDPRKHYPEARSAVEADALATMATAVSPAAVDLLAAQPALWRDHVSHGNAAAEAAAGALDRLLVPPTVVVVGRPNVGKSTLTNAMLGRAVSIVADLPGTTRDWVAGLAELVPAAGPRFAVAVRWIDTPGLRETGDVVEREAIALAQRVLASADVLIAMRDPRLGWPDASVLPRTPDLFVVNKVDEWSATVGDGSSPHTPLAISAARDRNLDLLAARVLDVLGLSRLDPPVRWAFSETLRAWARGEDVDLAAYLAED